MVAIHLANLLENTLFFVDFSFRSSNGYLNEKLKTNFQSRNASSETSVQIKLQSPYCKIIQDGDKRKG